MDSARILVVEDEAALGFVIEEILTEHGCEVTHATSAEDALSLLSLEGPPFDVALLDIVLPGMNGLALLGELKRLSPETEVLMMTSHSTVETVLQAIRRGAYDYLQKPFEEVEDVWLNVRRALERRRLSARNEALVRVLSERNGELVAAVERLESFIEAGRFMSEFESLPELLDSFLGLVAGELGVARASLMLVDEERTNLTIAAARGLGDVELASVQLPVGEGIAGHVAATGERVLVTDVETSPFPRSERPGLSSSFLSAPIVLSVPIKSQESILGVINVTNRESGEPFTENDLAYVSGMAGQLAVAIDRGRHFHDLQRAYDTLKATQEQLVFSERRKVVGEMAAGVAHDFNNDLSVILGKTQLALQRLAADEASTNEAARHDLEMIARIALRGAETIKRIQDYTRVRRDAATPDGASELVDINEAIQEAVEMTRPKWHDECESRGAPIDVRLHLEDVPRLDGNFHEISQMASNLIFNAVEAMPAGGTISFRTRVSDGNVALEVSDTGVGMDEDTAARVFEPFFTTKDTGNGLGTSIIFGIVKRHSGRIAVESEPGRGTTFRIVFPGAGTAADPGIASFGGEAETTERRDARILLVDDEDLVRATFQDLLEADGHSVTSVGSGRRAIELLETETFDLLITDMSMPEVSGLEVVAAAEARAIRLPVILLSGWAVAEQTAELREAGVDFVLTKPCPFQVLSQTIQQAIARGASV